jgi:CheY-like chemotaxis protein
MVPFDARKGIAMKILFVEDDAMNRRVVRDMLNVVGLDMDEAENAELGLRMVDEQEFDIILMDLRMPGMDGMAAIRKLRERTDAKAQVPIIVVTADAAATLREQCTAIGADDFLQKPVAMNALFESIGRVLAAKGSETALL